MGAGSCGAVMSVGTGTIPFLHGGAGGSGPGGTRRPRGRGPSRDKKVHPGVWVRDTGCVVPENRSEDGLLEGVFALGAGDNEAAAQVALEGRVLGELLALRKATGVLTVQKFGRFEALRLVCGGGDLLDAYLTFQRELERYRHAGRNEAAAALSVSSPADSVLDRLQLTAEALSPGDEWRDQRTARRWSDAGMPVIARDLVYFARVSGRLGGETLSVTLGGDAEAGLTVVVDQVASTTLPVRSPLVQVWHYPGGEEPRQVEVDLDRYGSATVRHPDRTMRRYRLLLDLPAIPPDDGGTADDDVPLLTVSVTGRDAPMRTVFFEDRSRLPPGCHARLACYRSIVTVDVVRDGGDDAG